MDTAKLRIMRHLHQHLGADILQDLGRAIEHCFGLMASDSTRSDSSSQENYSLYGNFAPPVTMQVSPCLSPNDVKARSESELALLLINANQSRFPLRMLQIGRGFRNSVDWVTTSPLRRYVHSVFPPRSCFAPKTCLLAWKISFRMQEIS